MFHDGTGVRPISGRPVRIPGRILSFLGLFDRFRRKPEPHPAGTPPTRENVVPVVKDAIFVARSQSLAGRRFCTRQICADIWALFAVYGAGPGPVYYLEEEDMAILGMLPDEVLAIATENLRTRLPPVQRHGKVGAEMLTCGGRYESSLVLFDDLWESLQEEISGDIVACVPAGDRCFLTGTAVPGGVERMRTTAERALAETTNPVSATLLLRQDGVWTELR